MSNTTTGQHGQLSSIHIISSIAVSLHKHDHTVQEQKALHDKYQNGIGVL